MSWKGKTQYRDTRPNSLWFVPTIRRDREILYKAKQLWYKHPAARSVMDSLRPRHILGGCILVPAHLGRILSEDNAFPNDVRPNRHHRKRCPVDKPPEKREHVPHPRDPEDTIFKPGAAAVITRLRKDNE